MSDDMMETAEARAEAAERNRRRRLAWTTLLLLVGLPIYLVVASLTVAYLTPPEPTAIGGGRPLHWAIELIVYVVLGFIWALPLKRLVKGLGRKSEPVSEPPAS